MKEWAEYIQAELALEELATAQAIPKAATSDQTTSGVIPPMVTPAVKALMAGDSSKLWDRNDGAKAPCRFWGTEEGCR